MLKTEGKTSIYYQDDTCEACGGLSHWGELINCRVFNKGEIKTLGYKHICPNCYAKLVKVLDLR